MDQKPQTEQPLPVAQVAEAKPSQAVPPPLPPQNVPVAEYFTPAPEQTNNLAVAGLVLGICSLILNILAGVPGIVISVLGIRRAKVVGGKGRDLAIAGLVLSCIGTLLGTVFLAGVIVAIRSASSMAAATARQASTMSSLQTLRAQLELYRLQHWDRYPTMAQMQNWSVMLQKTDENGNVSPTGKYGPYLASPIVNPLTGSSAIVPASNPVSPAGWVYDPATGKIQAAVPSPTPGLAPADTMVVP